MSLSHGGLSRRYFVHVSGEVGGQAALVMAGHGGGGNGSQLKEENGRDRVADREGFVAVVEVGPVWQRLIGLRRR